jgi:hypothetical protein
MTARARWLVAAIIALAVGGGIAAVAWRRPTPVRSTALGRLVTPDVRAPANTRVRVEIINASRTRGMARRATRLLRDRGFDVVTFRNGDTTQDATVVLDRTNHAEWASLVGKALGGARVETLPDTSRYVDVTVVLGATWRPPPQPFSP